MTELVVLVVVALLMVAVRLQRQVRAMRTERRGWQRRWPDAR